MKVVKYFMSIILGIILVIVFIAAVFINTSPEFGGMHLEDKVRLYKESGLYVDGKFQNQISTPMEMNASKIYSILVDYLKGDPTRKPKKELPFIKLDPSKIGKETSDSTKITWLGHSAFLIEMKGKVILLDPMFGPVPAPHPWLGQSRFNSEMPIKIEELPEIDLVLFSHDHYDHLDYGSILKLKSKVKKFFVPLGIGVHLEKWGVAKKVIYEFKWWDDEELDGIEFISTPARHFSGRGVTDRFSTLWTSWVIKNNSEKIYFSGDSGYGPHFKEIGERFGGFDYALMECGQYDERWSEIHMLPNETIQAGKDLKAKVVQPIHWGSFTLSLHPWNDPPIKASGFAKEEQVKLSIPMIGESVYVNQPSYPSKEWWFE